MKRLRQIKRSISSIISLVLGLIVAAGVAQAQGAEPSFTADQVIPSGTTHPTTLAPGMLISIYGHNLGPETGCNGAADTRNGETPSPLRPVQSFAERLIYPKNLCDVQVMVGERPAGLLYVQGKQINFKVPQETPIEGTVELRVIYQGRSSSPVKLSLGLEIAALSFKEPVRVGSPVWVYIELPLNWQGTVQYPVGLVPGDLGCHEFEVRRNGVLLPRFIPRLTDGPGGGLSCGNIGIPGHPMKHPGRLPLHLQYRFETPGDYEVRYTRKVEQFGPRSAEVLFRSAWTRLEVQPAVPIQIGTLPQDTAEILSDFLPGILGFTDSARLAVVLEYLSHPEEIVRQYAAYGLGYWPSDEVQRQLNALVQARGPRDVVMDRTLSAAPELAEAMLTSLRSSDPLLVRGAITVAARILLDQRGLFSDTTKTRAEDALIAAAEQIVRVGDHQTISSYAAILGSVHDERGHRLLWDLVQRHVAYEQSLVALTWRKDLKDLPRLAAILDAPVTDDPLSHKLSSLPYALHHAYGGAALPILENALKRSGYVWVQTESARELILENRPSGFAFVVDAIEQNRRYKQEMIGFIRERFPELRGADEAAVLAFVKQRAI